MQVTLTILSNQKSEVSSPDQVSNKEAIMQTFTFPEGETFVGMHRYQAEGMPSKRKRTLSSGHTRQRDAVVDGNSDDAELAGSDHDSDDDYYSTSSELADSEAG